MVFLPDLNVARPWPIFLTSKLTQLPARRKPLTPFALIMILIPEYTQSTLQAELYLSKILKLKAYLSKTGQNIT